MMNDFEKFFENEFDLNKILEKRNELEKYIEIIDEYVITSKTDLDGKITYVSRAFERISGFKKEELIGKYHNIVKHPDMPESLFEKMWTCISQEKTWSGEIKNKRKDGTYYWVKVKISPTYDLDNNHIGYTSVRQDISDKKKIEEVSFIDELTALYNRRYFNKMIDLEINRSCRDQKVFSFIILDVDNFKKYNDNYGHQKGDEVLKAIGSYLLQSLKRATDISFRIGGEEFVIIYSTNTTTEAITLAQKLCKGIEELQLEHNHNIDVSKYVTASFGLAVCDFTSKFDKNITGDHLYKTADRALYKAKNLGRNQVDTIQYI